MFCKHCGEKIDAKNGYCSHCGKAVEPLESGNGFWDIGRKSDHHDQTTEPAATQVRVVPDKSSSIKPHGASRKIGIATIVVLAICSILSIGALLYSMISSAQLRNALDENYRRIIGTIDGNRSEMSQSIDDKVNNLAQEISDLQQSIDNINSIIEQATEPPLDVLRIVSSPIDASKAVGYITPQGEFLFDVTIDGDVKAFVWQKQSPNGSWEQLEFDEDGVVEELGLRCDESIESGFSRISAIGLSEQSAGIYKCIVIGRQNCEKEVIVRLEVIVPLSPAPTVEPTPTHTVETPEPGKNETQTPQPTPEN